jgi:thiol-disulfide isomerase/thioredoxin
MISECNLALSPKSLHNADPGAKTLLDKAKGQVGQNRTLEMTPATSEHHLDVSSDERPEYPGDAGQRYRFERLALPIVLKDLHFSKNDPGPGDRVPDFDLPTVGGGRFRSSDLAETGPALLIFGSSTCPVTDNAAPGLNELYRRFGDRVRFVMVNVREAHPGKAFPQPRTLGTKMAHAVRLRDLHGFEFEVAVDDVDGTLHRSLGPKPNSAYVLGADGTILFRAHWANDTKALAAALDAVVAGELPHPSQSGGVLKPTLRILRNIAPVLDRAGSGAWADMWRVAAPLAAIALALKATRVRPRRP